jgi:ribose transport system permease protein
MITAQAVTLIVALAAMIPLIVGEFDLSVAAILGVSQVLVTGLTALQGLPIWSALLAGLACSGLLGLINGVVIVKFKVNAFVATLASGTIMGGLVVWYTGGAPIYTGVPESLRKIANGSLLGVPLSVSYALTLTVMCWFLLARLPVGRRMYVVGGNRRAAFLVGIPATAFVVGAFVASGVLSGAAGIILGSQLGAATPGTESSYLLPAFAGVFLGATAIDPGRFNPVGTAVAVYTLSVAVTGLQILGLPTWVTPVFNGGVLILAVGLSGYATRAKAARAKQAQLARLNSGTSGTGD